MWARAGGTGRDIFGDVALLVFLIAQASDGVLTYVGVSTYGLHIEANPLIGWLMSLDRRGGRAGDRQGRRRSLRYRAASVRGAPRRRRARRVLSRRRGFPWVAILFYY